jgi:hypothetical protein
MLRRASTVHQVLRRLEAPAPTLGERNTLEAASARLLDHVNRPGLVATGWCALAMSEATAELRGASDAPQAIAAGGRMTCYRAAGSNSSIGLPSGSSI